MTEVLTSSRFTIKPVAIGVALAEQFSTRDHLVNPDTLAAMIISLGGEINPHAIIAIIMFETESHRLVFDFNEATFPGESATTLELINELNKTDSGLSTQTLSEYFTLLLRHGTLTQDASASQT